MNTPQKTIEQLLAEQDAADLTRRIELQKALLRAATDPEIQGLTRSYIRQLEDKLRQIPAIWRRG